MSSVKEYGNRHFVATYGGLWCKLLGLSVAFQTPFNIYIMFQLSILWTLALPKLGPLWKISFLRFLSPILHLVQKKKKWNLVNTLVVLHSYISDLRESRKRQHPKFLVLDYTLQNTLNKACSSTCHLPKWESTTVHKQALLFCLFHTDVSTAVPLRRKEQNLGKCKRNFKMFLEKEIRQ